MLKAARLREEKNFALRRFSRKHSRRAQNSGKKEGGGSGKHRDSYH